jgi:hypothetical protein
MISRIRITLVLVAGGLLLAGLSAQAQGVVGSQHDLTSTNSQGGTTATDQVCVFCHTPHGADTTAPAPLWNKVLGNGGARFNRYSTLNTPSFDSAEAPVGSVSLACLSCHDGTQAMDVVLNRPGSDGYDAAGTPIDGGIGVMTGIPVPMLGEDLSNDHPISMQYAGGGVNVTTHPTDGTFPGGRAGLGDPDFVPPERATINGQPICNRWSAAVCRMWQLPRPAQRWFADSKPGCLPANDQCGQCCVHCVPHQVRDRFRTESPQAKPRIGSARATGGCPGRIA